MRSIASNYGHELRDLPEIQGNATAFNSYPTGPWQLMGTNLAIVGFWPIADHHSKPPISPLTIAEWPGTQP